METIGKAISKVKDGYLAVADWVEAHPHKTIGICVVISIVSVATFVL